VVQSQIAVERSKVEKADKSKGKASTVKKKGAREGRMVLPIFDLGKHVRSFSKVNLSLFVFGRAHAYLPSVV
jgi:hypothetical protein